MRSDRCSITLSFLPFNSITWYSGPVSNPFFFTLLSVSLLLFLRVFLTVSQRFIPLLTNKHTRKRVKGKTAEEMEERNNHNHKPGPKIRSFGCPGSQSTFSLISKLRHRLPSNKSLANNPMSSPSFSFSFSHPFMLWVPIFWPLPWTTDRKTSHRQLNLASEIGSRKLTEVQCEIIPFKNGWISIKEAVFQKVFQRVENNRFQEKKYVSEGDLFPGFLCKRGSC